MTNIANLEAWAITQGYDPNVKYQVDDALRPGYVSPHFALKEFACKCCGRTHKNGVPTRLLDLLEDIRAHFGKPVNINSGYRCPNHNAAVGGAKGSQHLKGTAADLWISGVDPQKVYDFADGLVGHAGGVGDYDTFTHIDVRGHKARW